MTPKFLTFSDKTNTNISLIIHGQGVFIFSSGKVCSFNIYNKDKSSGLNIEFNENSIILKELNNKILFESENLITSNITGAFYWISLDSQNFLFKAGIGEARTETVLSTYQFTKNYKMFLENLETIVITDDITPIRLLRDPITQKVPLLIKDTHSLTMEKIAKSNVLPKSNLSLIGQKLHDCISGKKFILDDNSFPDFSKAIERSIVTPGLWCNKRLLEKANEFGKPNVNETYLRITLGQNNGESPGIPYVMEIWPPGHYSPIHNHGGASAIIKVLHGSINVKLFPFLSSEVKEFAIADFHKNDITWISPTLNQVHQLHNIGEKTCVTIQCYMYENDDTTHYDYFDYIDDDTHKIEQFEPDSDMDFLSFKKLMKEEWAARPTFLKSLFYWDN
jgi:hypothetical protein